MRQVFVISPVLNEAENIPSLLDSWQRLQASLPDYGFEFILVDDGSIDNTSEIAKKLATEHSLHLLVLRHPQNMGPGQAFATAFAALQKKISDADIVVTMEGDNTSRTETLKIMLERMSREKVDVALASPYAYGGGFVQTDLHRVLLSHIANGMIKIALGIQGIHTLSSFFRAYEGKIIRKLQQRYGARILESRGFECMIELLKKIILVQASITEVPMRLDSSLRKGKSKMKILKTILGYFRVISIAKNWQKEKPLAVVAINAKPVKSPWGGGNQWLKQFSQELHRQGYGVVYDLRSTDVDCVVVLHSSPETQGGTFGDREILSYKRSHPQTKVIHRINENDARKNTTHMDAAIQKMNMVADYTIFNSEWLRSYHSFWFDKSKPNSVILNGADPKYFNPHNGKIWRAGQEPLILVTHHWSTNWNKGFKVYQQVDEWIANGALKDTELWVIGRWPQEIRWRAARTFPPCNDDDLANLLRQAHVYLTATIAEPGGNHFTEGVQCGLPLLYHKDGGSSVEVGKLTGGIEFSDNLLEAIAQMRLRYNEIRKLVLACQWNGEKMNAEYLRLVHALSAPDKSL